MNYQKIYRSLMLKSIRRKLVEGYFETHHIIPKCFGGSNDDKNLVSLTPEEHYVAHQLLVKMYSEDPDILWAAIAMTGTGNGKGNGRKGNKLYGWLRRRNSKLYKGKSRWSDEVKERIGEAARLRNQGKDHPMYGRRHTVESKIKMSISQKARKPISELTRRRMSKSQRANPMSEKTKRKIAAANRRRIQTPELIKSLSDARKLWWQRKRDSMSLQDHS